MNCIKRIKYFFIDIWWKFKNRNSELKGYKYYTPNIPYSYNSNNFVRWCIIPEIEWYIKYEPKKLSFFLNNVLDKKDLKIIDLYLKREGIIKYVEK